MRYLTAFILTLALTCCSLAPVTGCAGAIPVVVAVATIIDHALQVIDQVEQRYDQVKAGLPADLQARIESAIAKARATAEHARGAADAGGQAVRELREAYGDLVAIAAPIGVHVERDQGRLGAQAGGLGVPAPGDL